MESVEPKTEGEARTLVEEAEVSKHSTREDCWIIIGNARNGGPKVYDVTRYLEDHPGGAEVVLDLAGKNADDMFEDIGHSAEAREKMKQFYVGDLKLDPAIAEAMKKAAAQAVEDAASRGGLNPLVLVVLSVAVLIGIYLTQFS